MTTLNRFLCLSFLLFSEPAVAQHVTPPDYLEVEVSEDELYMKFSWSKKPSYPIFEGGTALEFQFDICPRCFVAPDWDPWNPEKDFNSFSHPYFSSYLRKVTNLPPDWAYFDVYNYSLPPTVDETWDYIKDNCPSVLVGAADFLNIDDFEEAKEQYYEKVKKGLNKNGNFAIGINDASKLEANKEYFIKLPVKRPWWAGHCTNAYVWISVQTSPRECRYPSWENSLISFKGCPYFMGGGAKYCGADSVFDTWVTRICAPTETVDVPVGDSSSYGCSLGNCEELITANSGCSAACYDDDEDGFFALQTDYVGRPVRMFGTNTGDCDDDDPDVDNSNYDPELAECLDYCFLGSCSDGKWCESFSGICYPCDEGCSGEFASLCEWQCECQLSPEIPILKEPSNNEQFTVGEPINFSFISDNNEAPHTFRARRNPPDGPDMEILLGLETTYSSTQTNFFDIPGEYRWVVFYEDDCCNEGRCYSEVRYLTVAPEDQLQECIGSTTESCGNCGTRSRTCVDGQWSNWGPCTGEGNCSPGEVQEQICNSIGTQTRICNSYCIWNEWSECITICIPNCAGKECGNDGCGGSCGSCTGCASECVGGFCQAISFASYACYNDNVWWFDSCLMPESIKENCVAAGMTCGWNLVLSEYSCLGVDLPPMGEIVWPQDGETLSNDFSVMIHADDDNGLSVVTVSVSFQYVEIYHQSTAVSGTEFDWVVPMVDTNDWTAGDYTIALWVSDGVNDPVETVIGIHFDPGDCTPVTCTQLAVSCGTWDDNCGSTLNCGDCTPGQECQSGQCVGDAFCPGYTGTNTCCYPDDPCNWAGDGYCDCDDTCPWDSVDCDCIPDCAGKECGDDGCYGQCGICSTGEICEDGQCVNISTCTDVYLATQSTSCYTNPSGPTVCLTVDQISGASWEYQICKQGPVFGNDFSYYLQDDNCSVVFNTYFGVSGINCASWKDIDLSYISGYGPANGAGLRAHIKSPLSCSDQDCMYETGYITVRLECQ